MSQGKKMIRGHKFTYGVNETNRYGEFLFSDADGWDVCEDLCPACTGADGAEPRSSAAIKITLAGFDGNECTPCDRYGAGDGWDNVAIAVDGTYTIPATDMVLSGVNHSILAIKTFTVTGLSDVDWYGYFGSACTSLIASEQCDKLYIAVRFVCIEDTDFDRTQSGKRYDPPRITAIKVETDFKTFGAGYPRNYVDYLFSRDGGTHLFGDTIAFTGPGTCFNSASPKQQFHTNAGTCKIEFTSAQPC